MINLEAAEAGNGFLNFNIAPTPIAFSDFLESKAQRAYSAYMYQAYSDGVILARWDDLDEESQRRWRAAAWAVLA